MERPKEPSLVVLVPSRGRPRNVQRLLKSMLQTCEGDTCLMVGLDEDDPELSNYQFTAEQINRLPTGVVVRKDLRYVVPWLNYLASTTVNDFDYIGTVGDDNVFNTKGWDRIVVESLSRQENNHPVAFCFGDDLHPYRPRGTLPCHVFMTKSVVERLGYMGPPSLKHMFVDNAWLEWGRATQIEFLSDMVIEHLHPSCGKASVDLSYGLSGSKARDDQLAFATYLRSQLREDVKKLRG